MADLYGFRRGRSVKNVDPQEIGATLERLRAEHGKATAELLLEDVAADENHPLRPGFEWDDSQAAHEHRLNQARRLVVSIRVLNCPVQASVPAFVSVRTPEHGRCYLPTIQALSTDQLRARVMDDVRQSIESLRRRYANFEEAIRILDHLSRQVG